MKNFILLTVVFAAVFTGCKDKLGGDDDRSDIVIKTSISEPTRAGVETRVDEGSRNFVSGDAIGLYVTEATKAVESVGNQIDNLSFTYNGTIWRGRLTMASLVGTTFKAYSYYPQKSTIDNAHEIEYKVKTDQSGGILPASYLLHGKSTSTITVDRGSNAPTVIPLSFTNCLTRVVAEITAPTAYNGKAVKEIGVVTLMQQPASCKLDVETGELNYDIYADSVDIVMHKSASRYECLTIPNSITPALAYMRIELIYSDDSKEFMYSYAPEEGVVFAGNQIHTLQISNNELSCYTNFVFGAAGGTIAADIRTNMTEAYTLKSNDSWITVAKDSVTVAVNTTGQPRLGSLTLSNGVVTREIVVLQEITVTIAGTKWLTTNLTGAAGTNSGYALCAAPQDYGMHFKWGDMWVYQHASSSTDGMLGTDVGNASTSPTATGTGGLGYDYVLGLSGGRAPGDPCQKLGSQYRTPTHAQFQILSLSGNLWDTYQGVPGQFFGPNAASCNNSTIAPGCIFFPAAGYRHWDSGSLNNEGREGDYWSSSVNSSTYGYYLGFNRNVLPDNSHGRGYGFSVRCVEDNSAPPAVTIAGAKWCTTNLTGTAGTDSGHAFCSNPQDYGMFFKWASTYVYDRASSSTEGGGFADADYTRGSSTTPTTQSSGYDYVYDGLNGTWPGDPCQKLGSSYKTPTSTQFRELVASGSSGFKTYNGINGWFFGPNAATATDSAIPTGCVFFPAAGRRHCWTGALVAQDSDGLYWSSSACNATGSWYLSFSSNGSFLPENASARSYGQSVRCVEDDGTPPPPTTVTIAGTKWLTANLTGIAGTNSGHAFCSNPQGYGDFFKWGDSWVYQHASSSTDGDWTSTTSGASTAPVATNTGNMGYDYAQGLSGGRASGDPCQKLGVNYRTPTRQQFTDLVASGKSTFTTYQGVNGYFFGHNAGSCNNTTMASGCVFFPAAGYRDWSGGTLYGDGDGSYWSSSVNSATHAHLLNFTNSSVNINNNGYRGNGRAIRCVEGNGTLPSLPPSTVIIAGTEWLTANLTGPAGTNSGHTFCSNPQDYGNFFKWGDAWVYGRASSTADGSWTSETSGASIAPIATNTGSVGYDYAQGLSGGRASGDPCQKAGLQYRTPTGAQYQALVASGTRWGTYKGVNGYFLGPNAASCNNTAIASGCIFIPGAGHRLCTDGAPYVEGEEGYYWSSSVSDNASGCGLLFYSDGIYPDLVNYRGEGCSVRCIKFTPPAIWATSNLGASRPQDYGSFYKWGDTFAYGRKSSTTDGDWTSRTSGASTSPAATGTGTLGYDYGLGLSGGRSSGDPCKSSLGSNWKTPTRAQFQELVASGQSALTTYQDVKGYFFGPSAASCTNTTIQPNCYFFPAAGHRKWDKGLLYANAGDGFYWASSVSDSAIAYNLYFYGSRVVPNNGSERGYGFSVRCIQD